MVDLAPTFIERLKQETNLEVYYELFEDSRTPQPCITWMQINDFDNGVGDTLGYSSVEFNIKIWAYKSYSNVQEIAQKVVKVMRELGYKKVAMNEIATDTQICKIFTYEGLAQEYFE